MGEQQVLAVDESAGKSSVKRRSGAKEGESSQEEGEENEGRRKIRRT